MSGLTSSYRFNFNQQAMPFTFFLGVDVSKKHLDWALVQEGKLLLHRQTENTPQAIGQLLSTLVQHHQVALDQMLVCMEHTGIYNHHLLEAFSEPGRQLWLQSARVIQHSMGLQQGKSDKLDAATIARYAYKNHSECRLWQPESKLLTQLKLLTALRTRLLTARTQLLVPLQKVEAFLERTLLNNSPKPRQLL